MKAPNMSWAIAYITVSDVAQSIALYKNALGFELLSSTDHDKGELVHAEMKHKDFVIMIGKQGAFGGKTVTPKESNVLVPISLYLYVNDVDTFYQNALANGMTSVTEPEVACWGDRYCRVKDKDGYEWSCGSYIGEAK